MRVFAPLSGMLSSNGPMAPATSVLNPSQYVFFPFCLLMRVFIAPTFFARGSIDRIWRRASCLKGVVMLNPSTHGEKLCKKSERFSTRKFTYTALRLHFPNRSEERRVG